MVVKERNPLLDAVCIEFFIIIVVKALSTEKHAIC